MFTIGTWRSCQTLRAPLSRAIRLLAVPALPDRSRIVAGDLLVSGDEPGKAVSLGVSHDETVKGIAGPLLVECGDLGPGGTMAEVLAEGIKGFSQPMHYAAASPGTLVGVSCIAFGLRGPTMNVTMAPQDGIPIALTLCAGWLERNVAKLMVLSAFRTGSSGAMMSRALLLAPPGFSESGAPLTESVITWLAAVDSTSGVNA